MPVSKIKITQIKSAIGRLDKQQRILKGLGLRRIHHAIVVDNTPEIRGMIKKILHLLKVEACHE